MRAAWCSVLLLTAACGEAGTLVAEPDGGGDSGMAPADAASSDADGSFDADAGPPADAPVVETGPACGSLGQSCCSGKCGGALVCTGDICACSTGSDCPGGGTCTAGRCLVTLARDQSGPTPLAIAGGRAVWGNLASYLPNGTYVSPGSLVEVSISGGATMTLVSGLPSAAWTVLAANATAAYWPGQSVGEGIVMTPLSGGASLVLSPSPVGSIAADATSVYWTDGPSTNAPNSIVRKMPFGGGTVTTLASIASYTAQGLALDAQYVYWTSSCSGGCANPGLITRVPLTGGTVQTLASFPQGYAGAFTFAVDATALYWAEGYASAVNVVRMPLGGGAPVTLAPAPYARNIAVDGTSVYWTDDYDGLVVKVPVAGGAPTTLYQGDLPEAIVVDATSVYWTSPSGGTVMRLTPK